MNDDNLGLSNIENWVGDLRLPPLEKSKNA
jgi:hypothetical protein